LLRFRFLPLFPLVFIVWLGPGCASQKQDFPYYHPAVNSERPVSLLSRVLEIERMEFENIHLETVAQDRLSSQHLVVIRKEEPRHYHAEHDLWVTVLKGEGEFWLEGTRFPIHPGSSIFIPRGGRHRATNEGKTSLAAFVIATPPYDGRDTVLLED